LKGIGFAKSNINHSLFTKGTTSTFIALLVYVDDIILVGNSSCEIQKVSVYLDQMFKVKDLGDVKYFLGLAVARSHKRIHIFKENMLLASSLKSTY